MGLLGGMVFLGAGCATVWYLRSPDGVGSHPLLAKPGMSALIALAVVSLVAGGVAWITSWVLS
jgi:hypothetical protein